jgi:hypothetical protein
MYSILTRSGSGSGIWIRTEILGRIRIQIRIKLRRICGFGTSFRMQIRVF